MSWKNSYTPFKIKKVEELENRFSNNGEIEEAFDLFESHYEQPLNKIQSTFNQMASIEQQVELLQNLVSNDTYTARINALDNKQGIVARNNGNNLPEDYQRDFAIGSLWLILED